MKRAAAKPQVSADLPEIVFHYTTLGGLLGILGADEIQLWASHIRFMNDSEKFTYAVRHLRDLIRAELDEQVESQRDYLKAGLKRLRSKSAKSVQVYACSFCRDGDLLSQWRGYGINNGYPLGFSGDVLRQRAKENGDRFFRVEYGAQEGAELLDAIREGIAYGGIPPLGASPHKGSKFPGGTRVALGL